MVTVETYTVKGYNAGHKTLGQLGKLGQKLGNFTTHTSILKTPTHVVFLLRFVEPPFPPDNIEIFED